MDDNLDGHKIETTNNTVKCFSHTEAVVERKTSALTGRCRVVGRKVPFRRGRCARAIGLAGSRHLFGTFVQFFAKSIL